MMLFMKKVRPEEDVKLDAEILRLEENLKTLSVMDDQYEPTVAALEKLYSIRQSREESLERCKKERRSRGETIAKIGTNIAIVGISAIGLFLTYKIDRSDEIVRNKATQGFFNKIFPPKV